MSIRRLATIVIVQGAVLLIPAVGLAQELEIESPPESGNPAWTLPALAIVVVLAIVTVAMVFRRRRRTTRIDDRLPEATAVREPVGAEVAAAPDTDASPEVLRLLENPAVAPRPGGAADLSADPWS